MLILVTGQNSFKISMYLKAVKKKADSEIHQYDGEEMTPDDLANALAGGDLFSSKKIVIIKNLSHNKTLWEEMDKLLKRLDSDTTLYLVEPTIDKRTKGYKNTSKFAHKVEDFKLIGAREKYSAYEWLDKYAQAIGVKIGHQQLNKMVDLALRTGEKPSEKYIDQWVLHHVIQKLSLLDEVTDEAIDIHMDKPVNQSVFDLLESAINGDQQKMQDILKALEMENQAPQMVLGLLVSQIYNLLAVSLSNELIKDIAKQQGVHPFALENVAKYRNKYSKSQLKKIILSLNKADERLKSTPDDQWSIIWQLLTTLSAV